MKQAKSFFSHDRAVRPSPVQEALQPRASVLQPELASTMNGSLRGQQHVQPGSVLATDALTYPQFHPPQPKGSSPFSSRGHVKANREETPRFLHSVAQGLPRVLLSPGANIQA